MKCIISATKQEKYNLRKTHWSNKEPTNHSVLGGWDCSHLPDIKCSNELLLGLIKSNNLTPNRAIDCAAGIGRITQHVLLNYFNEVDIVEQEEKFVKKAKENLYNNTHVKNYYINSIENFDFSDNKKYYDLIWIQWCLENIEDDDLNSFLYNVYQALNDNGIIIVKENIYIEDYIVEGGDNFYKLNNDVYSKEDLSKQRTDLFYINLFNKNGFKLIRHFANPNWPDKLMPLIVYVLKKDI